METHYTGTAPPPYTIEDPNTNARASTSGTRRPRPANHPRTSCHRSSVDERSPLLQTPATSSSDTDPECASSRSSSLSIFLLLLFLAPAAIVLCMGGGIYLDRSTNQDPADPRVRDRIRHEWQAEERSWKSKLDHYKTEADATLQKLRQFETELEEKKKQEARRRVELKVYWGDLRPGDRCIGDGTKVYTGKLVNFDWSIDAFEACRNTPVIINGVPYDHPDHCDANRFTGVAGTWTVSGEAECSAYWEGMKDAGCTASGSLTRRFEAHLSGVRPQDDAEAMAICFSTPAVIRNQRFERPMSCPHFARVQLILVTPGLSLESSCSLVILGSGKCRTRAAPNRYRYIIGRDVTSH